MFNDERIIIESGKISKKLYYIAMFISLFFIIIRIFISHNFFKIEYLCHMFTEFLILITTFIILIVGKFKYKKKRMRE